VLQDKEQCVFQLAHEVCHVLYPTAERRNATAPPTIMLNEGVSTYFSILMLEKMFGEGSSRPALLSLETNSPRYFEAYRLVSRLLQADGEAIKKLREVEPMLNDLTESDFQCVGFDMEPEDIALLLADF